MTKANQTEMENLRIMKKDDPEINLYALLDETNSIVNAAVELEVKHLRVTQPQVRILTLLSRKNTPVNLEELAHGTLKGFNSVSTLINRMENKDLVKKVKKEGDLKTYVMLTTKGSRLYHKQVTERSIHLILSKLSAEEKNQLDATLKKVRGITRDLMGLDYKPPFLD
jgi:DNA-binding MarR family transcriptional regulator